METEQLPIIQRFQTSLIAKIFLVCFVSVHVPLIALVLFLAIGFEPSLVSVVVLVLLATVVGTGICLLAIWRFIRPLNHLASALKKYPQEKSVMRLPAGGKDEIGVVADAAKSMIFQVEELTKQLKRQATTDFLTGLGNRRSLTEQFPTIQSQATRTQEMLSVILFDLDNFKNINDEHGHDIGDKVLMVVGEIVKDHIRPYDVAARIGGEEFCIILPRTTGEAALGIAERLRTAFQASYVDPLPQGRVTCSFGVIEARTNEKLQRLLARADVALYKAKDAGRNTVIGMFVEKDRDQI
ncbi:GGDEF domain-containing protein [Agrobacterium larrymoorei]|uniref:GGDEF domain-containing protein n=1 Tax=Agrobacterium larrymoorei TaxID=160699 RepID=UPI0015729F38|nr:GGDEF domain-containing protein [Agrobacterium larrymoorei]NTJ42529.1 GGDEF domain-containing protein [Agrobacterium larrymoorei]